MAKERNKNVRFIRKGGRIIPIRAKKKKQGPSKWGQRFGYASAGAIGSLYGIGASQYFKADTPSRRVIRSMPKRKRLIWAAKHVGTHVGIAGLALGAIGAATYVRYRYNEAIIRAVSGQQIQERPPINFRKYAKVIAGSAVGTVAALALGTRVHKIAKGLRGSKAVVVPKMLGKTLRPSKLQTLKAKFRRK